VELLLGLITPEHFFLLSWEMLGIGVIVGSLGSYVWGSILGSMMMIAISQGVIVLVGAPGRIYALA
jgi:hypothetical protein